MDSSKDFNAPMTNESRFHENPFDVDQDPSDTEAELARLRRRVAELEAEKIVHRPEEKAMEALFRACGDAVFFKDRQRRYRLVNPAMESAFGMPADCILGRTHDELFGPDTGGRVDPYDRRALGAETVEQEYRRPGPKADRLFHVLKSPVHDSGGRVAGILGVARDVTHSKARQEREEQVRRLESLAALAGGIAHEFNNALTVICGKLELLQMDFGTDPNIAACAESFNGPIRRMVNLTRQLLSYAQCGGGAPKTIFWRRFVAEAIAAMGMEIDPGIEVEADLGEKDVRIQADPDQVQMAISAIVINAVEAIQGQGRIRVCCGAGAPGSAPMVDGDRVSSGEFAWIFVQDDGVGMDAGTRRRLFEPFFTTKFQGRGLGMAAVYGIVKNHGGWIEVASEPGRGTRVCMGLPADGR